MSGAFFWWAITQWLYRNETAEQTEASTEPLLYSATFFAKSMDIEFSKLTDGKEDLFIRKWEGTINPKLKEIASLEKKNDRRH